MRLRSHLEHILFQVLTPESLCEFIRQHKPHLVKAETKVQVHALMELLMNDQVELDQDFLIYLTDNELFELGFQFGFEGKYNRWQMIEDICTWFDNTRDMFESDAMVQLPDVNCTHDEIVDWLGELTFNELQKICYILATNFNGNDYFHNLCENRNFDQVMNKLSMVSKELLHKVIVFYYNESSFAEAQQQELSLNSPEEDDELRLAYEILNVDKKSSNTEVKKSYYEKARYYHPDSFANKGIEGIDHDTILDNFRNVKKAFEIIKNSRPGPW